MLSHDCAISISCSDTSVNEIEFSVVKVADHMEQEVRSVCSQLYQLLGEDQGVCKKIESIEFSDNAFHIQTRGDFTTEDRYSVCEYLCEKMKEQEERQLEKLHLIHAALCSQSPNSPFDRKNCDASTNDHAAVQSNLRGMTKQYFSDEGLERTYLEKHKIPVLPLIEEITHEEERRVRNSIRLFMKAYSKQKFTGRSIARIFHGIQSPCYPAIVWGHKNQYWRLYNAVNFNTLCEIATEICGQ